MLGSVPERIKLLFHLARSDCDINLRSYCLILLNIVISGCGKESVVDESESVAFTKWETVK